MKPLLLALVLGVSGCSTITSWWPKSHDPVMFDHLVSVKIAVDTLSCDNKNWTDAETKIKHLVIYTELRHDPQSASLAQLQEAITKANATDKKLFCELLLKINKTRIDVVVDAWKGR